MDRRKLRLVSDSEECLSDRRAIDRAIIARADHLLKGGRAPSPSSQHLLSRVCPGAQPGRLDTD